MKRRSLFGALGALLGLGGTAVAAKAPYYEELPVSVCPPDCTDHPHRWAPWDCPRCGAYTLKPGYHFNLDTYDCDTCGATDISAREVLLGRLDKIERVHYQEPGEFRYYSGYDALEVGPIDRNPNPIWRNPRIIDDL